ncbi:sulfur carrier protein ThiS [Desulfofalx alkaliphila]|uniref:sulfur carrier protein ThiS n=1 Tax=Desulfofalx alkaliphila TaxID=105483 RepID=UPI0004E1137F|nr:sulfur carrier protein ThiS [Desulfofalx alkaliphila]
MIKVNGKDFQWEEGLTVQKMLEKKNYTFPHIVIKINGKYIPPEDYQTTIINKGDDVEAIHLITGG